MNIHKTWLTHVRTGPPPPQKKIAAPSARCGLSTRPPAYVDNIYLRHNARAVNIKPRHNAPSGNKRRKPKNGHLSVFVHNCHTFARAKLPGYVPGADPSVTTPPPACVIQFVVC